jgi:hypothetical protein
MISQKLDGVIYKLIFPNTDFLYVQLAVQQETPAKKALAFSL